VTERKPGVEQDGGYLDNAALHKQATEQFDDNPQPSRKERKLIEHLRMLKKKRLANGGKSTADLLDEAQEGNPKREDNDSDDDVAEDQYEREEEEFNEESGKELDAMESPTHYYECPVFQTTLRLSKYLEY